MAPIVSVLPLVVTLGKVQSTTPHNKSPTLDTSTFVIVQLSELVLLLVTFIYLVHDNRIQLTVLFNRRLPHPRPLRRRPNVRFADII